MALTDGNGHTRRLAYDGVGRLVCETRPLGQQTRYAYDADGNTTSREEDGRRIHYPYNAAGRLVKFSDETGRGLAVCG